jgi:hypothetical protein
MPAMVWQLESQKPFEPQASCQVHSVPSLTISAQLSPIGQ